MRRSATSAPSVSFADSSPASGGASGRRVLHRSRGRWIGATRRDAGGAAALAVLLLVAACAPKNDAPAAVALDCAQGFEAMRGKIVAQRDLIPAPKEPSEPYRAYSTRDGQASYFITEPGAPAHPAILMQQVTPQGMKDTGCSFGDRAAYAELQAYLKSLSAGRK